MIVTPIGLLLAAGFAAASAIAIDERWSVRLRRWQGTLRGSWRRSSSRGPRPRYRGAPARPGPAGGAGPVGPRAFPVRRASPTASPRSGTWTSTAAAASSCRSPSRVAFVLLAEALVAVAFGRAWHASWWEWHLLMAIAFGTILLAARQEYRRERSITETFGGLYTERTLERFDGRRGRRSAGSQRRCGEGDDLEATTSSCGRGLHRPRHHAAVSRGRGARAGRRSAPPVPRDAARRAVAPRARVRRPRRPRTGHHGAVRRPGRVHLIQRGRQATDVVTMLNAYWGAVVPAIADGEGGVIERFAATASSPSSTPWATNPTTRSGRSRRAGDPRPDRGAPRGSAGLAQVPCRPQQRPGRDRERRQRGAASFSAIGDTTKWPRAFRASQRRAAS